ncbi:lytic transglycosylase [Thiomicrorhabdus immobilis]|uniref:Lytic transglycosylase n=2 Tax=Thiomicrorhabdus immobilis TaxID=2791037 RepID=A0ABN6CX53_9GAMM|nr:lytic transglycosylase [Thiomicrorhabdus immobilis]
MSEQQKDFLLAYDAIKRNDRTAIASYKKKLKDYPLAIYITYHDYRIHLSSTPRKQINQFIKQNKNHYLADKLYTKLLVQLASEKKWTTFLNNYKPQKSQNLQCYHIQALANRKQTTRAVTLAKPIWQNSTELSSACQPLDKLLRDQKKLTGTMIWERIELAMNKRKTKLAKKLSHDLSNKDKEMFNYWLKVYKNPLLIAKPLPKSISPSIKKKIFTQGIRFLASRDPELADTSLNKFYKDYGLNKDQYAILKRKVALRSAYKYAPQAADLLNEVNGSTAKSEDTLRWQAQIALKQSNWASLLETIDLMPAETQQDKQWLYWKARALEAAKQQKEANDLYQKLAKQRNYYAFLAADRLKQPYQFNPNPVQKRDTAYLVKKYPELQRIQELMAIDWPLSAKREWYQLLNRVNQDELQAIAVLANQWEQYSQSIRSLAKAKKWHDLGLRFPTPHKEPVMQNADKNKIDPAWIYGIMRRESAFSEDVKSSVGAVGLMQLMPKTAKYIGKKIGVKKVSYTDLTKAENNIELGSAYLSYLHDKYDGNKVLATASYNAGPNRVDTWIPKNGTLAADQWIDSIPFTETRDYVKAVLEYTTIFKSLLNKKYDRLEDVMPPIGGKPVKQTDPQHP